MASRITHVYGLTETYGHTTICSEQEEWSQLSDEAHAEMKAQQGVGYSILQDWAVLDNNGQPCPPTAKQWEKSVYAATPS